MNIFVQDDYIFYKAFVKKTDGTSSAGIVRIKTDGTDYTVLADDLDSLSEIIGNGSFTIANGWIYYKAYEWIYDNRMFVTQKSAGIWRMRLDGSEKTLFSDVAYTSSINLINGKFYGMTDIPNNNLIDSELRIADNLMDLSDTQNIYIPENLNYSR